MVCKALQDVDHAFRDVSLDDWARVRDFFGEFKSSSWATRIDVTPQEFEAWFLVSLTQPEQAGVRFVEERDGPRAAVVALAVLQATMLQTPPEMLWKPHTFVRGVYVDFPRAGIAGANRMHEAMLDWGRRRGHHAIYGHVREDFKMGAVFRRYGYVPWNRIIGRPLDETRQEEVS